jgi:hypothetical protein
MEGGGGRGHVAIAPPEERHTDAVTRQPRRRHTGHLLRGCAKEKPGKYILCRPPLRLSLSCRGAQLRKWAATRQCMRARQG